MSREARAALGRLARYFERNGYFRSSPDKGTCTHRGYECRFSADDAAERDQIVRLLRAVGIEPGKPFVKGRQWRIPVYGKDAVARLAAELER